MFHIKIDRDRCKGCGLCSVACPKNLIYLSKDVLNAKGYHPAEITDETACIGCTSCALVCPDTAITIKKEENVRG